VTNSLFTGNRAATDEDAVAGGALFLAGEAAVINCTFSRNTADAGGGAQCDGAGASFANCVLRANGPQAIAGNATVTFSNIEDGWKGDGNIDAPPHFRRDPDPGGDGKWGTDDDDQGDLHPRAASPGIDAASNGAVPAGVTQDIDRLPRFADDPKTEDTGAGEPPIVDMGAYEYRGPACAGDVDGDGAVDLRDLLTVIAGWGACAGCAPDLDDSGEVGQSDLDAVLRNWGPCH
jgi:hypothetical protein